MATPPTFSAGSVLTAAQMNAAGLWLMKSSTFTTASTCPMESVFTSDYQNYKVLISMSGSAATNHSLVFYTGTNTEYGSATYNRYGFYLTTAGSFTNFYQANLSSSFMNNHGTTTANKSTTELTVFNPQNANRTNIQQSSMDASGGLSIWLNHIVDTTTSFTGFVLKPASGTLSGTIQVYGMR